jgi:DNA processing protein
VKAAGQIRPFIIDMNAHDRLCLLGLSHVEFLHPREKLTLIEMLGRPSRLFCLPLAELARLVGRRLRTLEWIPSEILRKAEETENLLTRDGMRSIFYWDSTYPPQLRTIYDPPVTLFLRGALPDTDRNLAGVVGTRFPTGAARTAAFRLGFELGREGAGVVSGLAQGVDREAHDGCLAAGGYSLAVLGNGIDDIYPPSSRASAAAMLGAGGGMLSEYPPGVPPLRYHFPQRNRIISGLCRSVVVIQAPQRSGALITADFALDQAKDLYVHAAGIFGAAGAGTRGLAEAGAPVISGTAEILRDWSLSPAASGTHARAPGLPEGDGLAMLLGEEIEGSCALEGGKILWRESWK